MLIQLGITMSRLGVIIQWLLRGNRTITTRRYGCIDNTTGAVTHKYSTMDFIHKDPLIKKGRYYLIYKCNIEHLHIKDGMSKTQRKVAHYLTKKNPMI